MEDIITALENIKDQGSFCTKRMIPSDRLNLEIKQFGQLKFPVTSRHAKALIKLAKPAKFGWRDKTFKCVAIFERTSGHPCPYVFNNTLRAATP